MTPAKLTDDQIVECIITELRVVRELPGHLQRRQSLEVLAKYRRVLPHLVAMAEMTVNQDGPDWTVKRTSAL